MRLEDWQKWLDTQFVEKSETPAAPAATQTTGQEEADTELSVAQAEPSAFAEQREAVQQAAVATLAPPAVRQEPVYSPSVEALTVAPAQSAPVPPPALAHIEEVQIPSIEQYMPFLRNRRESSEERQPASEPVAVIPPEVVTEEKPTPMADAATIETTTLEERAEAADEEPAQAALLFVPEVELTPAPPSSPRRYGISYRRARHARSVRPIEAVPELKNGELWSLVPKHIQVLVAIGSESDEVAQNSYKRSFRESRLELINRILDPTLSLEETARLLNVCPTTVRRYTNKGLLTHQRTAGDQRRFKLSDVLAFLDTQSRVGGRASS